LFINKELMAQKGYSMGSPERQKTPLEIARELELGVPVLSALDWLRRNPKKNLTDYIAEQERFSKEQGDEYVRTAERAAEVIRNHARNLGLKQSQLKK
jgi:hypothetical protein